MVPVLPSSLPWLHSSARFNLPAGRRQFNLQPNTLLCLTRGAPTFNYTFRLASLRVCSHGREGVCERVAQRRNAGPPENDDVGLPTMTPESIGVQLLNPATAAARLCFNRPCSSGETTVSLSLFRFFSSPLPSK